MNAPVNHAQLRDYFGNPRFSSDPPAPTTETPRVLPGMSPQKDPREEIIRRLQLALFGLVNSATMVTPHSENIRRVADARAALLASADHGCVELGVLPWEAT